MKRPKRSGWPAPHKTVRVRDLPECIQDDAEYSVPKRTTILAPVRVMVALGLDPNCGDARPVMPTQCCNANLRPATLPLRGRNPCAEPAPRDPCCDEFTAMTVQLLEDGTD